MAGSRRNDEQDDVAKMRQRVMEMMQQSAPSKPPASQDAEQDDAASMRARVEKIMGTATPSSRLPLRTEQEASSPVLQRMESLSSGDPFEMDLPADPRSRMPIGAGIGGIAGSVAGAPMGVAGAIGLGGLGSAGGEAVQQLIEHAMGSPDAPQSTLEAAKQMGKESLWGMASELGGRAVGALASKSFRRAMVPDAEVANDFVKHGMTFNGKPMVPAGTPFQNLFMTPAEMTGGKNYIQTLQNVAEGSFFGKATLEEFKGNRDKFLANSVESFTDQIGKQVKPSELGDLIANEVKGNYQAARAPARAAYQFLTLTTTPKKVPTYTMKPTGILNANGSPHMVKVQTGETYDRKTGAWVDVSGLKKSLETDQTIAETLRGLGAKEGGDDIVKTILTYPDKIPFFVAQSMRTRLQSMADVFSVENKKAPALGLISKVTGTVDSEIAKGLKAYSQDAHDIWRYANEMYKGANKQFNNRFLREILQKVDRRDLPEVVLSSLLQPQKFSDLAKVKSAVGPETWGMVQRSGLQRIIELSSKDGVVQPHLLEQSLFGPKGLGQEKMNVLFNTDQNLWLKKFIQAAHMTMKGGDTTGKMAIQLAQPAAMVGVGAGMFGGVHSAIPASSIAILATPPILSQIMTSPHMAKLFVTGMTTPATSPSAAGIVGRLLNMVMPRAKESTESSRGSERHLPSTREIYPGVDLQ